MLQDNKSQRDNVRWEIKTEESQQKRENTNPAETEKRAIHFLCITLIYSLWSDDTFKRFSGIAEQNREEEEWEDAAREENTVMQKKGRAG